MTTFFFLSEVTHMILQTASRENIPWFLYVNSAYLQPDQFLVLVLGMPGKNFNECHFQKYFLSFPKNWIWHFMQTVS